LKEHFGFEVKKDKDLMVWVFDLTPMLHLKVLGNLGNLGNLEDFKEGNFSKGEEQSNAASEKYASSNTSKIPKIPKIPKKCGECRFWSGLKCKQHPERVVVSPAAEACENFEPKEERL